MSLIRKEHLPVITYFVSFTILLVWISCTLTPWRDEIVTLYFLLPDLMLEGMRADVHHPLMNLFDKLTYVLSGSSDINLRIVHSVLSIFGQYCLFRGLRKKFSNYESLAIVALSATWMGSIYYSTSLRSNWSLIVVPEIIFGFYFSLKEMRKLILIPLLTFFCSLHLLNLVGIPFTFILASLWYEQRLPSKNTIRDVSFALIGCLAIYFLKIPILGHSEFIAWSLGIDKNSLLFNVLRFADIPPESKAYLIYQPFMKYINPYWFLYLLPLFLYLVSSLNGLDKFKIRFKMAGSLILISTIIYLGLIFAEYINLRLFLYRNLHFAYFLIWLSLGVMIFSFPKYRVLAWLSSFLAIFFNLFFMFFLCKYPTNGPMEKKLAHIAIDLAVKENAIIIACDDYFLFKIYPPPQGRLSEGCNPLASDPEHKRRFILTQLTWIGLTGWKDVHAKLLESGYTETKHTSFAESEFLKIYDPPKLSTSEK